MSKYSSLLSLNSKGAAGKNKVLFQLTGSIAAYKACEVISRLVKTGYEVKVAASQNALKFVGEATLEGLSGNPVSSDVFASSEMMSHIHLVRWADVIVLCPATAKTMNHLAAGTGDDLISTLYLAHDFKKPYLVAPAMNHFMYHHPSTQRSIELLRQQGLKFIEPESGDLACGETGDGRLAEPSHIYHQIVRALRVPKNRKVLVTFGGTEEPIDGVRSISNFSTGKTGAFIADELEKQGYQVTTLQAERSVATELCQDNHFFKSFNDLEKSLKGLLSQSNFDAVIHLAAVSDFSVNAVMNTGQFTPASAVGGKLSSEATLSLQLKRNKKLIYELKSYSQNPKQLKVFGFKLTHSASLSAREDAVKKLFQHSPAVDFVVHNDLVEIDNENNKHPHRIFGPKTEITSGEDKNSLAQWIGKLIDQGEVNA